MQLSKLSKGNVEIIGRRRGLIQDDFGLMSLGGE